MCIPTDFVSLESLDGYAEQNENPAMSFKGCGHTKKEIPSFNSIYLGKQGYHWCTRRPLAADKNRGTGVLTWGLGRGQENRKETVQNREGQTTTEFIQPTF